MMVHTLRNSSPSLSSFHQWSSYPDVLGMQFMWEGYFKQVGSAIIGCSPEFDFAMYSLCYISRPGKRSAQLLLSCLLGGSSSRIQTFWFLILLQVLPECWWKGANHPNLHLEQLILRCWEEVYCFCFSCNPLTTKSHQFKIHNWSFEKLFTVLKIRTRKENNRELFPIKFFRTVKSFFFFICSVPISTYF